jgi:hypothetical protein
MKRMATLLLATRKGVFVVQRAASARWAVAGAGGVGVSAAWSTGAPATTVRVDGLLVRDVSPQAVTDPIAPGESPVSYGVFVGEGSTLDAAAASVDRCDWGFFQSLGALALPGAAVTRSRVALGAARAGRGERGAERVPEASGVLAEEEVDEIAERARERQTHGLGERSPAQTGSDEVVEEEDRDEKDGVVRAGEDHPRLSPGASSATAYSPP